MWSGFRQRSWFRFNKTRIGVSWVKAMVLPIHPPRASPYLDIFALYTTSPEAFCQRGLLWERPEGKLLPCTLVNTSMKPTFTFWDCLFVSGSISDERRRESGYADIHPKNIVSAKRFDCYWHLQSCKSMSVKHGICPLSVGPAHGWLTLSPKHKAETNLPDPFEDKLSRGGHGSTLLRLHLAPAVVKLFSSSNPWQNKESSTWRLGNDVSVNWKKADVKSQENDGLFVCRHCRTDSNVWQYLWKVYCLSWY